MRAQVSASRGVSGTGYQSPAANWPVTSRNFVQSQTSTQPFPMRYRARLTYGVNVTLTTVTTLTTAVKNRFRLNSVYDPDVTNTGHQPY
jgi:hypothetical protein